MLSFITQKDALYNTNDRLLQNVSYLLLAVIQKTYFLESEGDWYSKSIA